MHSLYKLLKLETCLKNVQDLQQQKEEMRKLFDIVYVFSNAARDFVCNPNKIELF